MIYLGAFLIGILTGGLSAAYRMRQEEKRQVEISTFLSETPQSRILKLSNKLKPKVNNDEKAVEREKSR